MDNDTPPLRPSEFATFLGVGDRRARQLIGTLEALGFTLETDMHGARRVPAVLASAVKAARAEARDLATLRLDEALSPYLHRDQRGADLDPLGVLIEARAELAITREVLGALEQSLRGGSTRYGFTPPSSWSFLAVPDPRRGL